MAKVLAITLPQHRPLPVMMMMMMLRVACCCAMKDGFGETKGMAMAGTSSQTEMLLRALMLTMTRWMENGPYWRKTDPTSRERQLGQQTSKFLIVPNFSRSPMALARKDLRTEIDTRAILFGALGMDRAPVCLMMVLDGRAHGSMIPLATAVLVHFGLPMAPSQNLEATTNTLQSITMGRQLPLLVVHKMSGTETFCIVP
mmetsp:Transcript_20765/g.59526  ORF Transcript_20765/g.59526 Transcript_20765/m.59526 type:complete len:200 (-) Transcript_20765:27-626(-)